MRRAFLRLVADRRGGAAVELGLLLPVLFVTLFALLDLGRLGFLMASLEFAAQEGAHYAGLHGAASAAPATEADIAARTREQIFAADPAAVAVTVTWSPDRNPGSAVTVATAYDFTFLADLIGLPPLRLSSAATTTVY